MLICFACLIGVPVVRGGSLVGLVSPRDVMRRLLRDKQSPIVTRGTTQSHGPA